MSVGRTAKMERATTGQVVPNPFSVHPRATFRNASRAPHWDKTANGGVGFTVSMTWYFKDSATVAQIEPVAAQLLEHFATAVFVGSLGVQVLHASNRSRCPLNVEWCPKLHVVAAFEQPIHHSSSDFEVLGFVDLAVAADVLKRVLGDRLLTHGIGEQLLGTA